jgi:hypothetical protein
MNFYPLFKFENLNLDGDTIGTNRTMLTTVFYTVFDLI